MDQTYRISRDLLDWIKYTLLHRQRSVSLFIWIQCGGERTCARTNASIFMNVWKWNQQMAIVFKNAQIFQVAFVDWNIFLFPFCLKFCSYFLRWNPIFFRSIIKPKSLNTMVSTILDADCLARISTLIIYGTTFWVKIFQ